MQELRDLARTTWAMSVSSEVQRTLVKSPPELWAELSDPATLARHLSELGEIRIVRTEPDRAVDWEAAATDGAQASGRVEIEPSGWGTRVTLSASRAVAAPELKPEAEITPAPEPGSGSEVMAEPEPEIMAKPEPEPEVIAEPEPEPELEPKIIAPEPRPGFFARLFRRRRQPKATEPEPEPEATEPQPEATEPQPEAEPIAEVEIAEPAPVEPVLEPDISAELAELEEQTAAVLTGVLDRLGAAHHRPFSRA
jgi:hypothetical protein